MQWGWSICGGQWQEGAQHGVLQFLGSGWRSIHQGLSPLCCSVLLIFGALWTVHFIGAL